MRLQHGLSTLFLAATATAQLLTQGNGNLPSCGQSCSALTTAQTQCNGGSSTSLSVWSCFCQAVWSASGGDLTSLCTTSCSASDNALISTWYTQNCGSDNGASEHGGTTNTGGTGTNNGGTTSSSLPSTVPSTTSASSSSVSGADDEGCADWWSCHWKWVIMIIVIAVGLLILGFGGRWLKRRHDRKQDRISGSFNAGITTRSTPMTANNVNDSYVSAAPDAGANNSPSRTREAFMPYGYGYTRSESRLGGNNDRGSPLARGGTPLNEMEKDVGSTPEDPSSRSRRVMVRERIMGNSEKK